MFSVRFNHDKEAGEMEIIRRDGFAIVVEYKNSSDKENHEKKDKNYMLERVQKHERRGYSPQYPEEFFSVWQWASQACGDGHP